MLQGLRTSGLKLTPQRMAIVHELAADESHPTAQELFQRLRQSLPTMSFATVYNTLAALSGSGLCAAMSLAPGSGRFDPNMDPHDHLVCDGCGAVRDLPPAGPGPGHPLDARRRARLAQTSGGGGPRAGNRRGAGRRRSHPAAVRGFEVRAVEQIFRGLCAACARSPRAGTAARKNAPPAPLRDANPRKTYKKTERRIERSP